ncbi:hypothetical protein DSAG12_00629 [Promethearchaeum syntrophicum]|uniref:Uncharacterized protein n=1 Tax=Promethearchaeum syntrophicum TaxID=2594042 RepID=A0A5B9D6Y1_9ARCH|nr:hypothetical protein [Candidatus Prometheoarchaeum syntrophicum]QEE14812.1 hypothetical protein DSAG12_00629 [Candidatus Prometheoarchaeum syntrophicum]
MKIWLRSILAVLSSAVSWVLYIYLPEYLLKFVSGNGITLPIATIDIGSFDQLVFYVKSIGYMIVGITFAHSMAEKDTKIKPIWHLIRVFFKILFWGLFIFVDFSTIDVNALLSPGIELGMTINLTVLFWFMMGGIIFDIIATIFDFLAAFIPEKEKKEKIPKNREIENEMEEI